MIRAAFLAGVAYKAGATIAEVERATWIALGESGAVPVVRDARKNRPIAGHRWADVSAWSMSLVHWSGRLLALPSDITRLNAERITRDMLDVRKAVDEALVRIRKGSKFNAEIAVRDAVGVNGKILREIADVVMEQVRAIADPAVVMDLTDVVLFE